MKFRKNPAFSLAAILVAWYLVALMESRDTVPHTPGAEMTPAGQMEKVAFSTPSENATPSVETEIDAVQGDEKIEPVPPPKEVVPFASDVEDSESGVVWASGNPSPALPVVRGIHRDRKFFRPVTRLLPEAAEKSPPAKMALIPEDGRERLLPEEEDEHTLKSRRMVLDVQGLDRIIKGETTHLLAPTPGDEVLDLKMERILTRAENTHSMMGKITGEEFSEVNIVYHDGIVHGTVARYDTNQHFEYRILEDGFMMVRELDTASMTDVCGNPSEDEGHACGPDCSHDEEEDVRIQPVYESGPDVAADTSGWTTIDVVVGYGSQARINQGGVSQMEAHIIAAVDRMSLALFNSEVTSTELMLLGTIEDPDYVFPGNSSSTMGTSDELGFLDDDTDGVLDTVTDYAIRLGADLTSFVCASGQNGTAGIAYRPGSSSIVSRTSMSTHSLTFAHELGHNLGARHSWGDTSSDGDLDVDTARFGLRFVSTGDIRYQTIMAYSSSWGASRIPYFANPDVSFGGTPTGIADGTNLTGNSFVDSRYVSGGAIGTAGAGFDGSNSHLGARNAQMFLVQEGSNGVIFASNRAVRAGLGVTSPVSGEPWAAGTSQIISFTGGDMESMADIDLYKGGVYQETLADDVPAVNNRFFSWNIPLNQEGGNNYQIRITLTHMDTGATRFDESDFFIIQGTSDIILEAPVGGEFWPRNTVQNITWSSTFGGNVRIVLEKGGSVSIPLVESTPDDGSYAWTIPYDLALGSDYRILITSDVLPFNSSQSADDFTIVAPGNQILMTNLDTDPGFTTSGEFEFGEPGAGNGASDPYTGVNMYDTNLEDTSFGFSSLTSYALDCSNHTNIILDFWAYILIWTDYEVVFEISTDNSNWSELEIIGQGEILNQSWTRYTYDITDIAAGEPTVYIRWSMLGSGTQFSAGGLSIDDISVTGDFIPADGISVISPNGGENFFRFSQSRISWLSSMGGNVRLELLKNGLFEKLISETTPNDGTYYWTPPANQTTGDDYRIRISSVTDSSRNDESDADFSVAATPIGSGISYSESFESGLGAWTQSGTDDFDWSRDAGGTPSSDTGPSTGSDGLWYLYIEASDVDPNFSADLTNWFDLRDTASPLLTFHYHMYGERMGSLRLEASTDGSAWNTLFEESGTNENLWKSTQVDLRAYAGGYVQLKFSGTRGGDFRSDMAIDEISIIEAATTTYSISYNANAPISGAAPGSQIKGQGIDILLADAGTMTRAGYNCTGWNTAMDGSGTAYALADTYTADADLTLYAQWTFSGYLTWAGENLFDGDANSDGISNGLAWLLGASGANADISDYVPAGSSSGGDFVISFESLNAASRGAASLYFEHTTDLGMAASWTGTSILVPESSGTFDGILFTVTPEGNMNRVEATIPASETNTESLFGRLRTSNP